MEVKPKTYYDLKTMVKKIRKYEQGERILMHLQNAPIYYAKYKNEESEVKELIKLIKRGVAKVSATEEKNVNRRRSVTLEICFGGKETTRKRKTPRWILCSFQERRRNYMRGKLYLKWQLPRDALAVKRYGKGLLVQIEGDRRRRKHRK